MRLLWHSNLPWRSLDLSGALATLSRMTFSIRAVGSQAEVAAQLRQHTAAEGSFEARLRHLIAETIEADQPWKNLGHAWKYVVCLDGHHSGDGGGSPLSLSGSVTAQHVPHVDVPDTTPVPETAGS